MNLFHSHKGYKNIQPLYGGGLHGADQCKLCGEIHFWCYGNDHKTPIQGWVKGTIQIIKGE